MPFREEALQVTGHAALDDHGQRVGKITDVIYDESGEPTWATVKPGLLRREHYVPLEGSYASSDGDLVLPLSKADVDHAPAATPDHILTPEVIDELEDHYDLS